MSVAERPNAHHNAWLDLVRALAIGLVVARHGERFLAETLGLNPGAVGTVALNGWIGVDLFFALSGYLIACHLARSGLERPDFAWRRYLAMRALRILPAYYVVLALAVAGMFPLFDPGSRDLSWRLMYHIVLLQDYLPSDINVVFWSLGAEEKFYIFAPLLMLALLRCRSAAESAIGLACLFVLPSLLRIALFLQTATPLDYYSFWSVFRSPFHMTIEAFAAGIAVAVAQQQGLIRPNARIGAILTGLTAVALALWLASTDLMGTIDLFDVALQPPLLALACGTLVLGAVLLSQSPLPGAPAARAVATLSYPLYLVHYALIPLAAAIGLGGGQLGFWAAYLTLSILVALALHRLVERPFLSLKQRLAEPRASDAATTCGLPALRAGNPSPLP